MSCESSENVKVEVFERTSMDTTSLFLIPGDYYDLKLALRGNKISAFYQDKNEAVSCGFMIEGELKNQNPVQLQCYEIGANKDACAGFLKIAGDALILRLDRRLKASCKAEFYDQVGKPFLLDRQTQWTEIRSVAHETPIFDDYGGGLETTQILEKKDVVAVLRRKDAWVYIQNLKDESIEGWIQEYYLNPLNL